jgi:RNA polymerase sigma-70 factor (ECF subfamily)
VPTMIGPSFPAVLAAAQRGDEQAFAVLWRDLQPAVLRYLRVAAPEAAEDLAADTWVSIIRGLTRFRGDEPGFRALVFTAARHRALDWRRQSSRRQDDVVPVEALHDRPAPDDPAEVVLEGQSTRAALALIAELPRNQAEVVTLRVVAGLDVAQVARIVGKRPGAVRTLTHRGLRRLAQRLAAVETTRRVTP